MSKAVKLSVMNSAMEPETEQSQIWVSTLNRVCLHRATSLVLC